MEVVLDVMANMIVEGFLLRLHWHGSGDVQEGLRLLLQEQLDRVSFVHKPGHCRRCVDAPGPSLTQCQHFLLNVRSAPRLPVYIFK
eukprot:4224475-Prymnesium_polylepis.1